jgi:uncharacterized damage-inducible protein DinB
MSTSSVVQDTERPQPPIQGDERATLRGFLDFQRATLAWKVDGLGADDLRRRVLPTTVMTLLGLVRHMAEVERAWFRDRFADEDLAAIWCSEEDPDGEWRVEGADVAEALATWRDECDRARAIEAAAPSLDATLAMPGADPISLRWVMAHMVEEYARHNGHADLLREAIDGATGE